MLNKAIKPNATQTFKRKACQALVGLAMAGLSIETLAATGTITTCDFDTNINAYPASCTYQVQTISSTVANFYNTYMDLANKSLSEVQAVMPWYNGDGLLSSWSGSLKPFVWVSYHARGNPDVPNLINIYGRLVPATGGSTSFQDSNLSTSTETFNFLIAAINNAINNVSQDISLQSTSQAVTGVDSNINMMVYGAHSRPLSHLVAEGEKTAWVAGDFGRDDHGSRSGDVGLAEVNAGYNFGPAQVNVTLGQTWANQNLAFGGNLNADGQYVMVEAIAPISKERKLYAVVSGFGHWGDSDVRRGYINGGALASSKGNTDTETYGVRARLEWLDAKEIAGVQLSPYADISYVKSHMDGYTEKNGPTNATFDSRNNDNTTFRLGFNALRPISGTNFNFVANLEAAHATSDDSGSISGAIAGTAFNVASTRVQNDWVKAGVGAEGMIGQGKGSLMLNGTTSSGLPNAWLAASYQMNF